MAEPTRRCSVEGCDRADRLTRGLCSQHYQRARARGELGRYSRIRLPRAERGCCVEGCPKPHQAHGFCDMHYQRIKRHGAPGDAERKRVAKYAPDAVCDVIGCDKRVKVNGLCWMHDQRRRTSGDVGDAAPRRRRNGTGTRYKTPEGYVIVGPSDAKRLEHRVVMEGILGRPLRDYENVHHLNGVKHDNRPENLELWVTRQIKGQRLEDLLSWVVDNYPEAVRAALDERTQLRLAI